MTAKQFRSTAVWQRARAVALRNASACAICHGALGPLRTDLGPRHPLAPSVDHVRPLAGIDLATPEGRALAVDQALLRVAHYGCNARRGAARRRGNRPVARGVRRNSQFGPRADPNDWLGPTNSAVA